MDGAEADVAPVAAVQDAVEAVAVAVAARDQIAIAKESRINSQFFALRDSESIYGVCRYVHISLLTMM
jgi:hypothetical protein